LQSYPQQLSSLLGSPVCNAGVNGDTAKAGLARLQRDVLQFHPSVVVILFGVNDSGLFVSQGKKQVPLPDYRAQLESIIARVKASGARPVLATLPPINATLLRTQGLQPDNWVQYDATIRTLASTDGVTLVDLGAAIDGNMTLLQDGIHPTAAGATLIARAVFAIIGSSVPRPASIASPTP
jgi:lysophospholipase L1-like esterase